MKRIVLCSNPKSYSKHFSHYSIPRNAICSRGNSEKLVKTILSLFNPQKSYLLQKKFRKVNQNNFLIIQSQETLFCSRRNRKVIQNNPLIIQSPEKLFAPEEIEKLIKTILSLFNPRKAICSRRNRKVNQNNPLII